MIKTILEKKSFLPKNTITHNPTLTGIAKVKGDSMKDSGIIEGSLVYVKATNVVRNGDIAVVCVDDEVTIKFYEKRKDEIALIPSNSSYETKVFSPKEASKHNIKIIGKVLFCKTMF